MATLVKLYELSTLRVVRFKMFLSEESTEHMYRKKVLQSFQYPPTKTKPSKVIIEWNVIKKNKQKTCIVCIALFDSMFKVDVLIWSSGELAHWGVG